MKKRIKEIGSIIIGLILIILGAYILIQQSIDNYNTCINNGVDSNICEELLN